METIDDCDNSFVTVALRHGLLQRQHVDKILSHAKEIGIQPSDAALTLSMLELHEVDAINLLCRPADLASGYILTGLIGCGAGGMVFRARQTAMNREVALKTINVRSLNASNNGQSRMQRESSAIARLHHPHIVTAFDSGFHQGRFCIAMEWVDGETLADLIARQSPLTETVAWHIARQVASALAHANDAGIIHRDIKPANLLLSETPQGTSLPEGVPFVKVADFGLALQSSDSATDQLTATGTTLGTPAYVAPEQLHDTHVDARADIYSLGATVYHMLTGAAPCADRSPMRTIMQKTIGDDRWRDEIPDSMTASTVSLFREMTETNPEQRIGDYKELINRIDELLEDSITRPTPSAKPRRRSNRPSVRRSNDRLITTRKAVVIGSLVLGIGAGAAIWTGRTEPSIDAVDETTTWRIDGLPLPLFNGKSVPLFKQFGSWAPGVSSDGSRVLIGEQGAQMTIPLISKNSQSGRADRNLRLRVSVLVSADSVTEISLLDSATETTCATLQLARNTVTCTLDTAGTETSNTTATRSLRLPNNTTDDSVFQRVSFQRQRDRVLMSVNGEELGRVTCDEHTTSLVRFRCVENSSSFADIDVVAITAATSGVN